MVCKMGQFGTTSQAITLSKRNGQNNKKRENTRTRARDVGSWGKGCNWRRTNREGGPKGKSSMKREQNKLGGSGRAQNKAGGGGGLHLGIGGFDR